MPVGSALSTAPEGDLAAAEAADGAAARLGRNACDLAVVFVSPDHADAVASIVASVRARLETPVLIGAVAQGIVGPRTEVELGSAVSVWAASFRRGTLRAFRSRTVRQPDGGLAVIGWPDSGPDDVTLTLADPFSFPAGDLARRVTTERGGSLIGGLVTGGQGRTRLFLDDEIHEDGAVGVVFQGVDVEAVVSQGCRPVGDPLTVTRAEGNELLELGGRSATDRLQEVYDNAGARDRERLARGLHLGVVTDEHRAEFTTGDFLIRGVLGADPERGSVAVGDHIEVGTTIQFQVRDSLTAHDDLVARLGDVAGAEGTLLFTCNGRGERFFGAPHHDAVTIDDHLAAPVGGAFCAGEIGPVGDRSYLHGFTAAMLVVRDLPHDPTDP